MNIEVYRWGIHQASDGIMWLLQARGGMPAIFMKNVKSPFFVRKVGLAPCNHLITPTTPNPAREHMEAFRRLIEEDAVVRLLLPLPKAAAVEDTTALIRTRNPEELHIQFVSLLKMSSPTRIPILWMNLVRKAEIITQLRQTDVQPLILMGAKAENISDLNDIRREARTADRRLLIVGDNDIPWPGTEISSKRLQRMSVADIVSIPWEALGSMTVRGYMRSEWNGIWFTREPTPSNEHRRRENHG